MERSRRGSSQQRSLYGGQPSYVFNPFATVNYYGIWRRLHGQGEWMLTSHTTKGRTDKEAQSKVKRMFKGPGFQGMSLVAVLTGGNPNTPPPLG
jgi:hypothetical protein